MTDYKKIMDETKIQLKDLITKDSSQEFIKIITKLDKNLDSINEVVENKDKEIMSLKDDLISAVKGTGFKVSGSSNDDIDDQNQKSMDDIMLEELEKITAKQENK